MFIEQSHHAVSVIDDLSQLVMSLKGDRSIRTSAYLIQLVDQFFQHREFSSCGSKHKLGFIRLKVKLPENGLTKSSIFSDFCSQILKTLSLPMRDRLFRNMSGQ